jgi:hypothetical protein
LHHHQVHVRILRLLQYPLLSFRTLLSRFHLSKKICLVRYHLASYPLHLLV